MGFMEEEGADQLPEERVEGGEHFQVPVPNSLLEKEARACPMSTTARRTAKRL